MKYLSFIILALFLGCQNKNETSNYSVELLDSLTEYHPNIAKRIIDSLLIEHPNDNELLHDKFGLLYNSQNFDSALIFIERILTQEPQNPNLYYMKGMVQDYLGRPDLSIHSYKLAYELNDSSQIDPSNSVVLTSIVKGKAEGLALLETLKDSMRQRGYLFFRNELIEDKEYRITDFNELTPTTTDTLKLSSDIKGQDASLFLMKNGINPYFTEQRSSTGEFKFCARIKFEQRINELIDQGLITRSNSR